MQYDLSIEEMKGKILLTDNKAFLYCVSFASVYYVSFLFFLLRTIVDTQLR
ncbi:MAG: hypothetical protein P4L51_01285 [Puia sp.]|nr:hypothetical protein [Puia sp.]